MKGDGPRVAVTIHVHVEVLSIEGRVFEVVGPEPMRTAAGLEREVGAHATQVLPDRVRSSVSSGG